MMTSYIGNPAMKNNPNAVCIARYVPGWWGAGSKRYSSLAPSIDLLRRYKAGLPWPDYCHEYNDYLETLDPQKIWEDLHDKILCCYEKPGENCHRHLVATWLEIHLGVSVPEAGAGVEHVPQVKVVHHRQEQLSLL